jgi:hypothetical protein
LAGGCGCISVAIAIVVGGGNLSRGCAQTMMRRPISEVIMSPAKKSVVVAPGPSSALDAPITVEVKAGVFKDTCLELMDDVRDHRKQVIITKHGAAVAKLVAPDAEAPSACGFLRGTLLAHGDIVAPDFEAWGELGG